MHGAKENVSDLQFFVTTLPSIPVPSIEQPSEVWRDMALTLLVWMPVISLSISTTKSYLDDVARTFNDICTLLISAIFLYTVLPSFHSDIPISPFNGQTFSLPHVQKLGHVPHVLEGM